MYSLPTPPGAAHRPPCSADPDRMFPAVESVRAGAPTAEERAALSVCSSCPLLAPCREWALDVRLPYGVAGALTAADRRATRRTARRGTPERAA